ncbi:hypothetical protein CVT25_005972 [Psilocybe cyanescens]|uniref:Uncharacterized protein n=1 Tax=Psilocybe cyanescens TaxID=93625 RepID=A0A409VMC4_PSICY|nr:hypothetical protein CVT25_005972 [Psilocybe cyanescens]
MDDRDHSQALTVPHSDSPGSSVFDLPIQATNPSLANGLGVSEPQKSFPSGIVQNDLDTSPGETSFLVISGGTGGNAICSAFRNVCYVLPVSDDGGSSSEIIRVLGGPSVGDIRSRLIRLIPYAASSSPLDAIRRLLAYRLPSQSSQRDAREEWRDIVEGKSRLWKGIPTDRKETIRGFLVYFESELLKRAHKNFDFRNGRKANILPVIVTNHIVTIAAELEDGEHLVGQCEISHPMVSTEPVNFQTPDDDSPAPDGIGEYVSPRQNVMFESVAKETHEPLPSRISTYGLGGANTTYPISAFITDLVYLKGTKVPVDVKRITLMGVRCREFDGAARFDADTVAHAMKEVWAGVS